ncbi:MAG: hypothetical protein ACI93R_001017 [Flavobacteriales bacterium]|jgi:hypothetical protein
MSLIISQIRSLLKERTAISLKELQVIFKDRSARSLSRDLTKIGVITSYTHAGQYRVRAVTARFNTRGLWFYQDIGFSKYRTLKSTILHMTELSDIGCTHKELNDILKIKTHNTLKDLVDAKSISRRTMPNNIYVYLHHGTEKSQKQYDLRLSIKTAEPSNISPPPQWITIEILAEIVRCCKIQTQSNIIYERLDRRGLEIKKDIVEQVFSYYQIKKKPT